MLTLGTADGAALEGGPSSADPAADAAPPPLRPALKLPAGEFATVLPALFPSMTFSSGTLPVMGPKFFLSGLPVSSLMGCKQACISGAAEKMCDIAADSTPAARACSLEY